MKKTELKKWLLYVLRTILLLYFLYSVFYYTYLPEDSPLQKVMPLNVSLFLLRGIYILGFHLSLRLLDYLFTREQCYVEALESVRKVQLCQFFWRGKIIALYRFFMHVTDQKGATLLVNGLFLRNLPAVVEIYHPLVERKPKLATPLSMILSLTYLILAVVCIILIEEAILPAILNSSH